MENHSQTHIVKYRTYFFVLLALVTLTLISVGITGLDLGNFAILGALVVATIKASLVLWHFMHLKYEGRILRMMIGLVLFVFVVLMVITFLDYDFQ
jgi:cytochrome c oxidase subunit 4